MEEETCPHERITCTPVDGKGEMVFRCLSCPTLITVTFRSFTRNAMLTAVFGPDWEYKLQKGKESTNE